MTETKPPGQCCYEAYVAAWTDASAAPYYHWRGLPPAAQRAWEAAAQAVLTLKEEEDH